MSIALASSVLLLLSSKQLVALSPFLIQPSTPGVIRAATSSCTMLRREDLRWKRLVALGVEVDTKPEGRMTKDEATATPPSKNSGGANKPPPRVLETKPVDDVIDLCHSDDDDDQEEAWKQQKKKAKTDSSRRASHSTLSKLSSNVQRVRGRSNVPAEETASRSDQQASIGDASVQFHVATWNVWFGPQCGPNPHVKARMTEMTRLLREQWSETKRPLWFVGFQEVTGEAATFLKQTLPGYRFIQQTNGCGYYCMLAVRQHDGDPVILDSNWVDFNGKSTIQSRGFCYARVRLASSSVELLVATTHLESFCSNDYKGVEQRKQQLKEFEEFSRQQMQRHTHLRCCIFMGDLNWDDERKNPQDERISDILTSPFVDVWLQSRTDPRETSNTYDGKLNPMLNNNLRRRFDRCLVFGRHTSALPRTIQTHLLGTLALPGLTYRKKNPFTGKETESPIAPSDHFGFIATLRLNQ